MLDYIDLCDDEDMIDLTSEEDNDAHEKSDAAYWAIKLQRQDVFVACEQGGAAGTTALCNQEVVVTGNCREEAMKSGNQDFVAAGYGAEEATQSANQEFVTAGDGTEKATQSGCLDFVVAGDGAEEAIQSGNQNVVAAREGTGEAMHTGDQAIVAAGDGEDEAIQSGNQDCVAANDGVEEAMQPGKAAEAASSSSVTEQGAIAYSSMTEQWSHETSTLLKNFPPISTKLLFSQQFWKAGEYRVAVEAATSICLDGQNRLRIHPKFLHSNATSHKWALGAIAELLDNAVDEVHNGATFVKIDKIKYSPIGEYSLVIQDDGGGMNLESLRHCMSFGFSKKCTNSSIGQYGNGFKTSTMRLGADVIVFSCTQDNRRMTGSVGLLSSTFLTRTGCNDILVPLVDYEFDEPSCTFKRIMNHGEKHFTSRLSTVLRWSPFSTEKDLLNQFGNMGSHGTKIIIFNLWFNDASEMELDFTTEEEDIMVSGGPEMPEKRRKVQRLNHMHVANRFRYSLRVYASILYLHLPVHFKVILCGRVVEPHHIVSDLLYRECIRYRPQVGGTESQVDVITTIGFLRGAPKLDIHGFNVYHKNRLILPFWSASRGIAWGRGIAGVLEANFIRPTHDKQDFEKTQHFRRLETRLREMTLEYWRHHCHLIGYTRIAKILPPAHFASVNNDDILAAQAATETYSGNSRAKASVGLEPCSIGGNSLDPLHVGSRDQMDYGACSSRRRNMRTLLCIPGNPLQKSQTVIEWKAQQRQNTNDDANHSTSANIFEMGEERSRLLICMNKTLKTQCSELEAAGQQLLCKTDQLRNGIHEWLWVRKGLIDQLKWNRDMTSMASG